MRFIMPICVVVALLTVPSGARANRKGSEPPIVKEADALGHPFLSQTYQDIIEPLSVENLSIAQRIFIYEEVNNPSLKPIDTKIECEIDDQGNIQARFCQPIGGAQILNDGQRMTMDAVIVAGFPDRKYPHFIKSNDLNTAHQRPFMRFVAGQGPSETLPAYRLVHLTAHVDSITPPPPVDFSTGTLVPYKQIPDLLSAIANNTAGIGVFDYPMRALREGKTGNLTLECQVQADLSVICREKAFDPPENGSYFDTFAAAAFQGIRVKPTLANGGSAVGVRTLLPIRMQIPKG